MQNKKTSADLYKICCAKYPHKAYAGAADIENILAVMENELFIDSWSPLVSAAWKQCCIFSKERGLSLRYYVPEYIQLRDEDNGTNISTFDAWYLLILLADYIHKKEYTYDLGNMLKFFFGNYVPREPVPEELTSSLRDIDIGIQKRRRKACRAFLAASNKTFDASAGKEKRLPAMDGRILPEMHEKADVVEENQIIQSARKEAENIISHASAEAEKKLAESKKRFADMINEERAGVYAESQQKMQDNFSGIRNALLHANQMLKQLEDSFSETTIKKIYIRLLELYNLIADTRDSDFRLAQTNQNNGLEDAAYNMDVFLDMIAEYLADFGISSITSQPGDRFSPKYHDAVNGGNSFHPRNASVKDSLRRGFIWGEQVIQKEKVEIYEEDSV